jgi:hypothetical protein
MNYTITEVFLDEADKYRVRVIIDEHSTQFFKFDHYPTQEEVNEVVMNYLKSASSENNFTDLN